MHMHTFKVPTMRQAWQLIQQGDFAFSVDLKDVYMHIPFVKCHHHHLCFVCQIYLTSGMFCLLGQPWPPGLSLHLLNPYCSFASASIFCIIIYLDDILVLIHPKFVSKRAQSFVLIIDMSWTTHSFFQI